jgi:hypothetical protein
MINDIQHLFMCLFVFHILFGEVSIQSFFLIFCRVLCFLVEFLELIVSSGFKNLSEIM